MAISNKKMKTYNIYFRTALSGYNILNIDHDELSIVIDAYATGKESFFIAGTKYWFQNLLEIKVFEFENSIKFDSFIDYARKNDLFNSDVFEDPHLTPDVLKTGGRDVTREFIKGEYGGKNNIYDKILSQKSEMEIFISHSSEDANIAEALSNVIIKAFKLENKSIRCTSVPGFKLPAGASTEERLKQEIFASRVFIGVITSKSISSTYVLFELGARWGATLPLLPLICDPKGTALLQGPLKNINGLNATNISDLHQFIHDISHYLKIKPEDTNGYLKEIEILRKLSSKSQIKITSKDASKTVKSKRSATEKSTEHLGLINEFEGAEKLIKTESLKQWPDDFEMQAYYIEKQTEALNQLKMGKPTDIEATIFNRIREKAKRDWPLDFEMRHYTEQNQMDSLRKLNKK